MSVSHSGITLPTAEVQPAQQVGSVATRQLDRRSKCPYPDCGREFKDLAAHILTHQQERPEKCPIESCEYHTKGFARKYDKNRHALTHYKGTMTCPFCPGVGSAAEKTFNRADIFKRHLASMHQVEQTPPNSRKLIVSSSAAAAPAGGSPSTDVKTEPCTICLEHYPNPQDFYEHLDDCVLNVIVPPSSAKAGGRQSPPNTGDTVLEQGRDASTTKEAGRGVKAGAFAPGEERRSVAV